MAFKLPTMTRETSTSTSTGDMVMAGAQSGYFAFSTGLSNGDTTFLTFKMGADEETGKYTYNSGPNSFTRTQIYRSTNANAAVNWAAGTKDVICGLPGADNIDAAGLALLASAFGFVSTAADQTATATQRAQGRENLAQAQVAFSSSDTILTTHREAYVSLTSTGTMSYTAAATLGDGFEFEIGNDGTGVWTHDPNSSETFEGSTTYKMYPGERWRVRCDGTKFIVATGRDSVVLIDSQSPSAAGDVRLERFDSTRFFMYLVEFVGFNPSVNGASLLVTTSNDAGATYAASGYWHQRGVTSNNTTTSAAGSASDTSVTIDAAIQNVATGASSSANGRLFVTPDSANTRTRIAFENGSFVSGSGVFRNTRGDAGSSHLANGLKMNFDSGANLTGLVRMFGYSK